MPSYIVKICDKYLEFSTIVDSFTTRGMTREQFTAYYRDRYGSAAMPELAERLERVDKYGTSSMMDALADRSAESEVFCNRIGEWHKGPWTAEGRTELTWEEVQDFVREHSLPDGVLPEQIRG